MVLRVFVWLIATVTALASKDDYSVSSDLLPGLTSVEQRELIPEMHAGQVPLDDNDDEHTKQLFFWRFHDASGRASAQANNTLIFWLNGGPGCSSMDGALMESGPLRVDKSGKLYLNAGGWHTRGDIVFVDQPAGTGFSTVGSDKDYDDDLELVADHFLEFLRRYFDIFPDDRTKNVVIAGESYAGQYIPIFATSVLNYNRDAQNPIRLSGLLIGNGWIDPDSQSLSYVPFALEKGIISETSPQLSSLLRHHEECQNRLSSGPSEGFSYPECEDILTYLLEATRNVTDSDGNAVPPEQQCLNIYDYRLRDTYPSCGMNWPQDLPNVSKFFGTDGVLEALHLDPQRVPRWRECDSQVSRHLNNPHSKPSVHLLPSLLESGLQIILFNGDQDIICNNMGVEKLIDDLSWGGQKGFSDAMQYYNWVYNDTSLNQNTPAGFVKYDRNLTFISVYNASHMVPFDNALISRGIVDIFLNDVILVESGDGDTLVSKDIFSEDEDDESTSLSTTCTDEHGNIIPCKEKESEDVKETNNNDEDKEQDKEEKEDDEEDDEEDEDEDEDEDDEDEEDEDEDRDGKHGHKGEKESDRNERARRKFTLVVVYLLIFCIVGLLAYIGIREYFRPRIRAILVDPNNRPDSSRKTVSWADDLEQGGADLDDFGLNAKKKGAYTSVPNEDTSGDSFELEDY